MLSYITKNALYFFSRERGKARRRECLTCDEKRGEGKGKMDVQTFVRFELKQMVLDGYSNL